VKFATLALQVGQATLPPARSKFSKHQLTQPQLLAILCLMRYEDWTFRAHPVTISWLFVAVGESQLTILDLADWTACRPRSEPRLPDSFSLNILNFYPATRVYGVVTGRLTSLPNHLTKSDDEPQTFS
jgi:hypothetical protein